MFKSEKYEMYMLGNMNIFVCLPLHDVYHEKSHFIEVDTWLGGFDMTFGSLWVFIMIV